MDLDRRQIHCATTVCSDPETKNQTPGHWHRAEGCERGVRICLVSFHAPVTGRPAISRGLLVRAQVRLPANCGCPHAPTRRPPCGAGGARGAHVVGTADRRRARRRAGGERGAHVAQPPSRALRPSLRLHVQAELARPRRGSRAGGSASCLPSTSNATRRPVLGPGAGCGDPARPGRLPGAIPTLPRSSAAPSSSRSWCAESCPGLRVSPEG